MSNRRPLAVIYTNMPQYRSSFKAAGEPIQALKCKREFGLDGSCLMFAKCIFCGFAVPTLRSALHNLLYSQPCTLNFLQDILIPFNFALLNYVCL
jgi:hypothetical protein